MRSDMTVVDLYKLGYHDLVSIIPPDAHLSASSNVKPEMRGKAPGKKYPGGWGGYNWRAAPPVALADLGAWGEAGVGIKTDQYPAVDIDVPDETLAALIKARAVELLGLAPDAPLKRPSPVRSPGGCGEGMGGPLPCSAWSERDL